MKFNKLCSYLGSKKSTRYLYWHDEVKYFQRLIKQRDYVFIYELGLYFLKEDKFDKAMEYFYIVYLYDISYLLQELLFYDNRFHHYLIMLNLPQSQLINETMTQLLSISDIYQFHEALQLSTDYSECCVCLTDAIQLQFLCNHSVCFLCYPKVIKLNACPLCRMRL
jgi:hypothetical protein